MGGGGCCSAGAEGLPWCCWQPLAASLPAWRLLSNAGQAELLVSLLGERLGVLGAVSEPLTDTWVCPAVPDSSGQTAQGWKKPPRRQVGHRGVGDGARGAGRALVCRVQ